MYDCNYRQKKDYSCQYPFRVHHVCRLIARGKSNEKCKQPTGGLTCTDFANQFTVSRIPVAVYLVFIMFILCTCTIPGVCSCASFFPLHQFFSVIAGFEGQPGILNHGPTLFRPPSDRSR
jgi:hypothetical protein